MSSQPEPHVAVHLRCFLCDDDIPETDGKPPPHPIVSRKSLSHTCPIHLLNRASQPNKL